MSFVPIIFGKKDWDNEYDLGPKYKNFYCPNCHNYCVKPVKRREFISIWFIPIFPMYFGKQLMCPICNWRQDFKDQSQLDKVAAEQVIINKQQQ
ncbi:uncharacterized protein SCDLUD_000759 [Saccharomycodes ludwigii]|uniref:uncharacterized protein n=1 Tax=Saccharomycodes ludwigii TaxID=36035 RepID=UPI001E8AA5DD|nr:hypothetical protein SCDLUD_000759 [Saccharomycodes ludwigii]KAH3903146.1 hypothetical protein SCDLUD_000759 [Saccharomycodes ludwigii]